MMLKKFTALALAALTLLLCFGCVGKDGGSEADKTEKAIPAEKKIALITGGEKRDPEGYAMAASLKAKYGDNLIVRTFSDDYLDDLLSLTSVTTELAANKTIKAVVFANGVEGTAHAALRARDLRSDLCIIVCNPVEDINTLAQSANLVLLLDYKAVAQSMVRGAAEMGAKTFVFYTFQRHADYAFVADMRKAAGDTCKELDLKYVETYSVDAHDEGRSEEIAKTFVGEDFYRKTEKYGKNIAFYATDPLIQEELIQRALERDFIVAATASLSPVRFAGALGVDIKGHETDFKYVLAAVAADLAKSPGKGKMASWQFSAPMITLETGFEYAYSFLNADATWTNNLDTLDGILGGLTDGMPYSIKKYKENNEKIFLLGSDFYIYGAAG